MICLLSFHENDSAIFTEKKLFLHDFYVSRPLPVRENASFGRSDDVTILLFRPKIAKVKRKKI